MRSQGNVHRAAKVAGRIGVATAATAALVVGAGLPASGHGYIGGDGSALVSRAALVSNSGRGPVQYEPQSIEGPKGFPAGGPGNGRIASGGVGRFQELDEQSSTRWVKNAVAPGVIDVGWKYTAPHATSKWHYYVTKPGWDQNAPLTRDALEPVTEVLHDGSAANSKGFHHSVTIPSDREGYHVLLGVWDVADTPNAFYQVVDLDVQAREGASEAPPSAPLQLASKGSTESTVSLSWKGGSGTPVDHYKVFRDGKQVGRTTSTTFVDTELSARTKYSYHVVAVSAAQVMSSPSNTITARTGSSSTSAKRPGAPRHLHTMAVTADSVDLMWSAPEGGNKPTHYLVHRATADGDFAVVGTTRSLEFTDGDVAASTRYRYRVTAIDKSGNASKPSNVITVTTEVGGGEVDGGAGGGTSASNWDPYAAYVIGDTVDHGGRRYVCIQSYQGHGDPNWIQAPSLWTAQR